MRTVGLKENTKAEKAPSTATGKKNTRAEKDDVNGSK